VRVIRTRVKVRGKPVALKVIEKPLVGAVWRITDGCIVNTGLADLPGEYRVEKSFSVVSGKYKGSEACIIRPTARENSGDGTEHPCVMIYFLEPVMSVSGTLTPGRFVRITIQGGFPPYAITAFRGDSQSAPMRGYRTPIMIPRGATKLSIRDCMKNLITVVCRVNRDWEVVSAQRCVEPADEKYRACIGPAPEDEASAAMAWDFPLSPGKEDEPLPCKRSRSASAEESAQDGHCAPAVTETLSWVDSLKLITVRSIYEKFRGTVAPDSEAKAASGIPPKPSAKLCSVCMDAEPDTMLLPCRHMHTCWKCWEAVQRRVSPGAMSECPTCRTGVIAAMKAFV
jgi:hypothetical protein